MSEKEEAKLVAGHDKEGAPIMKARYWWAVLWTENLVDGWEDKIADLVQVPFAYAVHDSDTDSKSEHRKDHVHVIIAFSNTTTKKHALAVFKQLGKSAVNTCQAIINIRHAYDYLIHDTETCRKAGKHEYGPEHRVAGNGFDIGMFEQISQAQKEEMSRELSDLIIGRKIGNIADFYVIAMENFGGEYFEIIRAHNAFYDRLCRGIYLKYYAPESGSSNTPGTRQGHESTCPECGSAEVKKKGKTAADQQRYQCKECGKTFV